MKAFEFQTSLDESRNVRVPEDVAGQLAGLQSVRVILLVPDDDEDRDWARLTAEQFLKGYDDADAIYDQLPER